jgi:hypothetical protein
MKTRTLRKNSNMYLIGDKGRQEITDLRVSGRTYQEITDFLNELYLHVLNKGRHFTILQTFQYFKKHKAEEIALIKETKLQGIKKRLSKTQDIVELTDTLNKWLKEYEAAGEKLTLKDTITSYIKLYELKIKIDEMEQKTRTTETSSVVKDFISKVQQEFGNPKVTQELKEEYNEDGTVKTRESKVQYSNEKDNNIIEAEIIEGEEE